LTTTVAMIDRTTVAMIDIVQLISANSMIALL
jgi:hypothetical protein